MSQNVILNEELELHIFSKIFLRSFLDCILLNICWYLWRKQSVVRHLQLIQRLREQLITKVIEWDIHQRGAPHVVLFQKDEQHDPSKDRQRNIKQEWWCCSTSAFMLLATVPGMLSPDLVLSQDYIKTTACWTSKENAKGCFDHSLLLPLYRNALRRPFHLASQY